MSCTQKTLKTSQICLIILAFLPTTKLFMLPSILAGFSGEDLWISALINILLDALTITAVLYASKKYNCTFFELLEDLFGKTGSIIVLLLYFFYFMLKAVLPLSEQKDYVELTLYTLMPTLLYFLPFFLVAFYISTKNVRVFGRAADVLWLITLLGLIILFSLSITNCDFASILPIGAHGAQSILKGSLSSLTWFGDAAYFLFLIGEFKYNKKDGVKILLFYLLYALLVLCFIVIFYSVFNSIAHRQKFALTEISKYTTVINNVGRFDYVGILFILFSNMFSLSLPVFFATKILERIFNIKNKIIAPLITVGIQFLILICFYQFSFSIENFIMNYASFFFLIMGNFLPIFISLLKRKEQRYEYS